MDEFDRAQEVEMRDREIYLYAARQRRGPGLLPSGSCFYCGEDIVLPKLFCNSECAEDWEHLRRRR